MSEHVEVLRMMLRSWLGESTSEPSVTAGADALEAAIEALSVPEASGADRRSTHHVHRGPESLPCYCDGKADHAIGHETTEPRAAAQEPEWLAALRKEVTLFAPMKSSFTLSRDELAHLFDRLQPSGAGEDAALQKAIDSAHDNYMRGNIDATSRDYLIEKARRDAARLARGGSHD